TALDSFNNTASGYGGTVRFSSTDALASLATSRMLSGGGGLLVAAKKAGSSEESGMEKDSSAQRGISNAVTVVAGAATQFGVSGVPTSVTAGQTVSFSVTALDSFNNTASGYAGTVRFSSTDVLASLPSNSTLSGGTGLFAVALKTA